MGSNATETTHPSLSNNELSTSVFAISKINAKGGMPW